MPSIIKLMCIMVLLSGAFAASGEASQTVLFDTGHGQRFLIGKEGPLQLSGLAQIVQAEGVQLAALQQPISDQSLAAADALIISGAFAPLQPREVEALLRFMERGGKLAVMLHIAPPLDALLIRLNMSYTNGVIREEENIIDGQPQNFQVKRLGKHPVLNGISSISMYGVWGLINLDDNTRLIASTSPRAWIDVHQDNVRKQEYTGSFGVVAARDIGKGGLLVFGDDAIFQNKFLAGNKALAVNLAGWLSARDQGAKPAAGQQ